MPRRKKQARNEEDALIQTEEESIALEESAKAGRTSSTLLNKP
jgi:hypothetical protein